MKKLLVAGVVAGLFVGSMLPAQAAKKKKPKAKPPVPVAVDLQYFLRDADACDTSENLLSLTDAPDPSCWYVDSGAFYEVLDTAGLLAPEDLAVSWTASDGLPFTLDASKRISGEITTRGGTCVLSDPAPCSPATLSAGSATLDVIVRGTVGDEDIDLGTFTETFTTVPGTAHTSVVDIELDPALDKKQVTNLTVLTYIHGASVFHGTVALDDPSSFVKVPAWQ